MLRNSRPYRVLPGLLVLLLPWPSCVPHVEIEGAPCPCPAGYSCCETLAACLPSAESCPEAYPPSSDAPCARDSDCPSGELCQAWSSGESGLYGPQACRRDCSTGFACDGSEKCALVLHDGAAPGGDAVAQACTSPDRDRGCDTPGCRDCNSFYLGKTFCQDKTIHACFQNVHPDCGLLCQNVMVQACGAAGCMDTGGQTCNAEPSGDPCESFPCDVCPDPARPSELACEGATRLVGCLVADYAGKTCTKICKPVAFDCPGSSTCSEDGGAHCSP